MTKIPAELKNLLDEHQGLVTQRQALDAGLAPHVLAYWARKDALERVQRGMYRFVKAEGFENEHLLEVALRVPRGVVCLMSAAALHELGTFIPHELHLAIPRGSHAAALTYPPVAYHHFSDAQYAYGIEEHCVGSGVVKIYSKEKTLADLLRFRNTYGLNLFLEALKDYLGRRGYNTSRLLEAARVCRVEKLMRQYATAVLA